ncbi:transmembrane protein [Cavenderia fasciculata]|uniref:Transmembrane protein n=1 Tax=Cavenderia fasciculata TaxID=261658 RepID=F4QDB8_CACFS|nr:uncharacterized protein DFA_11507 [Cavenderia fasciculata]EGG13746.1 transmembrane protein [Cavenderia fasciculata]|eukprot:XP_004350452.1 transmembrane protein [Cavenderia fasciculata]
MLQQEEEEEGGGIGGEEDMLLIQDVDKLEQALNDTFDSLNSSLLSKKEIMAVLLVECFSSNLYPRQQQQEVRKEITDFLTQSFTFLSIPHPILNYLIVNSGGGGGSGSNTANKLLSKNGSSASISTMVTAGTNSPRLKSVSSMTSLSTMSSSIPMVPLQSSSSFNSLQSLDSAATAAVVGNNNNNNNKDNDCSLFIQEYIPKKIEKSILDDMEHILDYQFHNDMESFITALVGCKKQSTTMPPTPSNSLKDMSALYTGFIGRLTNQSSNILPTNIFPIDLEKDDLFSKRIETLSFIEPDHLGISIDEFKLNNAKKCIGRINSYQTPIEKQRCISKTMVYLMEAGGEDYLLPMAIYLLLRTNPPYLWSNYRFLELYSTSSGNLNVDSIYDNFCTTFSVAIQFIDKLDHTHLSIDNDYFQQQLLENQKKIFPNQQQEKEKEKDKLDNNNNNNNNAMKSNETILTTSTTELEKLIDKLDVNNNDNNNNNTNNEQLENIVLFKQLNRLPTIIDILKPQLHGNEIEEFMLKFITISLGSQYYHSTIRFPLRRFFIEFLGISERTFCVTEMEIIGSLQDSTDGGGSNLELLPNKQGGGQALKVAKIAGAAVTGAVIVGLTGGLAAPFVGSVFSALGAGSILTGITGATGMSGATMLSVIFGAAGAKVSADKMITATSGVKDYTIHKVKSQTSLHAIIYVDGFSSVNTTTTTTATEDAKTQEQTIASVQISKLESWEKIIRAVTNDYGDIFLIDYEKDVKKSLHAIIREYQKTIVQTLFRSAATNIISTSLAHALVPLSIIKAASVLDNPWTLLKDRSEKVGKILAQQIVEGGFGKRPLTLIGTSMGSRVIFYCLEELSRLSKIENQSKSKEKEINNNNNISTTTTDSTTPPIVTNTISPSSIIEMVVFIGSPITSDPKRWSNIISMVSGRVINCYSPSDLVLKYVSRSANCLTDGVLPPAGVTPIHIPSSTIVIENVDVSKLVKSHLDYDKEDNITRILNHIAVNKVSYCDPKVPPKFSGVVYQV